MLVFPLTLTHAHGKVQNPATGEVKEIVHPYHPGSVYHMTKCLDNVMMHFYAKNDRLRLTDLHQGIVWGAQTEETLLDPKLINRPAAILTLTTNAIIIAI